MNKRFLYKQIAPAVYVFTEGQVCILQGGKFSFALFFANKSQKEEGLSPHGGNIILLSS